MVKKGHLSPLKAVLLIGAILLLLLHLPLGGEENESKGNLRANEDVEKKSSLNLDSFQLTIRGDESHKFKLNYKLNQTGINPVLHKSLKKQVKSRSLESSLFTTSLITLTFLNVADYFSTIKALKYDGLKEANPIMKLFTKNTLLYTTIKIGLTAYNYYFLKDLFKKNKKLAWAISTTANFAMSYIVANNLRMIHKSQKK